MPRWRALFVTFSILVACLLARPAAAEAIIKLVSGDLLPYAARELPGGGMLTEVVQLAFKRVGIASTLDWMPWKRGYELTRIAEYDATFPYARKPDREQEFLYSDLLVGGVRSVYARPDSGIDPASLETFRGKRYCVPNGFIIYPQMDVLVQEGALKINRPGSLATCAKMVALDRADFYITESTAGDAALLQADIGAAVIRLPKPFDRAEYFLIVSKTHPEGAELIAQFNRGLKLLKASGDYQRILKRHQH